MRQHRFAFDGVFEEEASQEAVFEEVGRDAVEAATNGFNATLFAYGQTGSGKTYTLSGGTARYEDRGIVPRALSMIFERVEKIGAEENAKFTVEVSYVEIYMEQGYDLLATTLDERESAKRGYARKSEIPLPKIRLLEDEHGRTHAMDLTSHAVASEAEALDLLLQPLTVILTGSHGTPGQQVVLHQGADLQRAPSEGHAFDEFSRFLRHRARGRLGCRRFIRRIRS